MTLIHRGQLQVPRLPTEEVDVDSLGGGVQVRGLLLSDRFRLSGLPQERYAAELLARTVLDADGEPLFTAEQWDIWGVGHLQEAMMLVGVAQKLSGLGEVPDETPLGTAS